MFVYFVSFVIIMYVLFDINYFLRTYFTVVSCYLFQRKCSIADVTTIYGMCTFQDCDVWLRNTREARLLRDIDFARYHFYQRTGLQRRIRQLKNRLLQGSTLVVCNHPIPMFKLYKINTKLVYWDDCSLFFEYTIITMHDDKVRYMIISRQQHALGVHEASKEALFQGQPGLIRPECPAYIEEWLLSMQITSSKIRS